MGLIWCGGEDIDFPGTPPAVVTDGSRFRGAWARCAVRSNTDNSSAVFSKAFPGGPITSAWLGFRTLAWEYGWDPGIMICGLVKVGTNGKGLFIQARGSGSIGLCKSDGQGNYTYLGTPSGYHIFPDSSLCRMDLELIDYGATSTINVYVNGSVTPAVTFSGDCRATGISDLDGVCVYGESWGNACCPSEIIVATDDTRTMYLATLAPQAVGDQNEWIGAFDLIDEITQDDADLIYVQSVNKSVQFNLTQTPTGTFSVYGLKVAARACRVGSAVTKLQLGVKSAAGSGGVDLGAAENLDVPYNTIERYLSAVNGVQLTQADLDALQIAFKSAA